MRATQLAASLELDIDALHVGHVAESLPAVLGPLELDEPAGVQADVEEMRAPPLVGVDRVPVAPSALDRDAGDLLARCLLGEEIPERPDLAAPDTEDGDLVDERVEPVGSEPLALPRDHEVEAGLVARRRGRRRLRARAAGEQDTADEQHTHEREATAGRRPAMHPRRVTFSSRSAQDMCAKRFQRSRTSIRCTSGTPPRCFPPPPTASNLTSPRAFR